MSGNKTSTQPPDRIIDIDGLPILAPTGYDDTLQAGLKMIDHMEACNVDRSDMQVAIANLYAELIFHTHFLAKRKRPAPKPPTPPSGEVPCSSSDNPNHEPANPTPNPKD